MCRGSATAFPMRVGVLTENEWSALLKIPLFLKIQRRIFIKIDEIKNVSV